MRNFSRVILIGFLLFAGSLSAQTLKFGHIDFNALLQVMPETSKAQDDYNKFVKDLGDVYNDMTNEYNQKMNELQQLTQDTATTEVKRNAKLEEVQTLQQRLDNYQQKAQTDMQNKQSELYQPIVQKAKDLVGQVAKENGLIYVFDSGTLVYFSNQSVDLLPLVKKKLGLQ